MFESVVASVLNRVLGRYIDNLEGSQLSLSILNGNATLTGLKLKADALDELDLPIEIVRGYVGELRLEIPWANLKSKPVTVTLDSIFVHVSQVARMDIERTLAKQLRDKLDRLATSEMLRASAARVPINTEQQADSFTTNLVNKIVDNLQVSVKNIHVRFEDADRQFSIGFLLTALRVFSVDKDGVARFISVTSNEIYKAAELSRLFIYTDHLQLKGLGQEAWMSRMEQYIQDDEMTYILRPVNGIGTACIQRHIEKGKPRVLAKLSLEEIDLMVDENQFLDLLLVAQRFILLFRRQYYLKDRPQKPMLQSSRDWMTFVFRNTASRIRDENYRRTIDFVMERGARRREYIGLYKSKMGGRMGASEKTRLEELDRLLPYQDIRIFRMLARRVPFSPVVPSSPSPDHQKASTSWWSYIWGSSSSKDGSSLPEPGVDEVKELMETIDYDEEIDVIDDPKSVRSHLVVSLKLGKLSLLDSSLDVVIEVLFRELVTGFIKRQKSSRLEVELSDLSVREGISKVADFQQLLKSKLDKYDDNEVGNEERFLNLAYDTMTDSDCYSASLLLRMKPLQIIVNHEASGKLKNYLFSGDRGRALKSLSETAANNITQLKARTLANLQYALSNHQSVSLDLSIEAPIVLLPLACGRVDVPMFILDMGDIRVSSRSIPPSRRKDLVDRYRNESIQDESDELFEILYDQALVQLSKARVFYVKELPQWTGYVSGENSEAIDHKNLILDQMDLDLVVGTSIVRQVEGLVETKIRGNLPPFSLNFGDHKWRAFMALVDILMGKSGPLLANAQARGPGRLSDDPDGEDFFDAIEEQSCAPMPGDDLAEAWEKCRLSIFVSFERVSALFNEYNAGQDSEYLTATVVAERLAVRANIFPKNIQVRVILEQFGLYDNRNFLNFDGPIVEGRPNVDSDASLLQVNVDYVDADHPQFFTKYKGAKIHVDVEISNVQVCLEPVNFFTHLRYIATTFGDDDQELLGRLAIGEDNGQPGQSEERSLIMANASISEAIFALGRGNDNYGDFIASRGSFRIFVDRKRDITVHGSLHSVNMLNKSPVREEILDGRHFITNEGQGNIADFAFQTFSNPPGSTNAWDSSLALSAGSLRITYMPTFLRRLLCFVNSIKDSMNIATRRSANPDTKMKVSIDLLSPVVELVREPRPNVYRSILVYLGNMSLQNEFEHPIVRQFINIDGFRIDALTGSDLHVSKILMDTSMKLVLESNSQAYKMRVPGLVVRGEIDDLELSFGRTEYNLFISRIYHLLDTISPAVEPWFNSPGSAKERTGDDHVNQEIGVQVPKVVIRILKDTVEKECFAHLQVEGCLMSIMMRKDTSLLLNLSGRDLIVTDPRDPEAPFWTIVPSLDATDHPKRLELLYERDTDGFGTVKAQLKALEVVFALNYVFALKSYLIDSLPPRSDIAPFDPNARPLFQVYELDDLSLYLIEDPSSGSSEALRLSIDSFIFTSKDNSSVIVENLIGAFINMDKPESTELQLIEPLDINCSIEYEKVKGIAVKTTYSLVFDQLVARLSSEDYLFIQSVWSQFISNVDMSMYVQNMNVDENVFANTIDTSTLPKIGREKLLVCCNLLRLVLIDDLSKINLPLCDLSFEKVEFELLDWSADSSLSSTFQLVCNAFNLNNSHWEPLLEPTVLQIVSKKSGQPAKTDIVVSAERNVDFVLTQAFASMCFRLWKRISSQGIGISASSLRTADRQVSMPYQIFNYTGYPLAVWNDHDPDPQLITVDPDSNVSWSFEDWRLSRRLLGNQTAKLSLQLLGSEWESLKGISIDKIGLYVYSLKPKIDGVLHKLACEVILVGSIKHVFIRPTVVLKNRTKFPLLATSDNTVDNQTASIDIPPNGYAAFPVKYSHRCTFRLKPTDMEYDPTTTSISVPRIMSVLSRADGQAKAASIQVKSTSSIPDVAPFYFLVYSKPSSIRSHRDYPVANLVIRAPIELHNLLPHDVRFRMYDLDAKYDFGGSVGAGKTAPLHAIRSDHLVGISVEIDGTFWRSAEVASMNCAEKDLHDDEMRLKSPEGNVLNLRMHLEEDRGSARTVKIYCPYIVLNQTGLQLDIIETKGLDVGPNSASSSSPNLRNIFSSRINEDNKAEPILFSFSGGRTARHRVKLRAEGSQWSESVSIDALGTISVVHMKNLDSEKWYNLSISPKPGGDRYSLVKMIHIGPAYIIVNRLGRDLMMRGSRAETDPGLVCPLNAKVPFHFDPDAMKKIQVRTSPASPWSNHLDFSSIGKVHCRVDEDSAEKLLRMELALESGTCFVFVDEARSWPFVIENKSDFAISFNQVGGHIVRDVPPGSHLDYAWDEPGGKSRSIEISIYGRKKEINVNEIGQRAPFPFRLPDNTKRHISIDVVASGPVIKVKFGNVESDFKVRDNKRSPLVRSRRSPAPPNAGSSNHSLNTSETERSEASSDGFEVMEVAEEVRMVTVIRLPFVGLSVVRKDNKELLYLACKDVEVRLSRSNLYFTYGLQVKSIQLDNQMFDWQIPIILFPAYSPVHGNSQQQAAQQIQRQQQNHLRVALIKSTDTTHGIDCYSYFGFLLQETIVEIGNDTVARLNDFLKFDAAKEAMPQRLLFDQLCLSIPQPPRRDPSRDTVYFELFQIHPIKLTVTSIRTEGFADDLEAGGVSVNPFFAIQEASASYFLNVSQAPLTFNALILEHPIVSLARLQQLVHDHYVSGFFGQIAKMVGSADFIFNPLGLFNNLGSGVSDFFYEPYLGFVSDRPQDIGIGFLKGGFSLVRKTVFGLTDSFSKFTGSIGKGLSALTFDKSFQQRRRLDRARNRPRHALFGVVTGARQLIEGVAGGIGGLVEKPLEGAKEEGAEGFFKGIAIGLAGALSKPFVGAVDMVTSVTEGIRNSADPNVQDLQQVRLARVIPFDGIVRKHKEREARGQSLLYNCIGHELFKEFYMGHLEDDEGSALFITCRRILAGRVQSGRIIWEVEYDMISAVRADSDAIVISMNSSDLKQRRIACSCREVQDWFVERVNLAMTVFNESNR